jgi:hypothetical protein
LTVTICNENERKDLKKLTRKLGQRLNTYSLKSKGVN